MISPYSVNEYFSKKYFIITLVLFWIGFTYWRTQYLGFFSDDWILLSKTSISPETFSDYLKVNHYARPLYSTITWLENFIAQGSAIGWQIISSITILISGIAVFKVLKLINFQAGYSTKSSVIGAAVGTFFLFSSPWALGVSAWSTGVLTLWSLIFFCFGYIKIHSDTSRVKILGIVLVLLGFLVYEAYWFSFIPLLIMTSDFEVNKIKKLFNITLLFSFALLIALIYQRVALPYFLGEHSKPLTFDNLSLVLNNISGLYRVISSSISPLNSYFCIGFVLLTIGLGLDTKIIEIRRPASVLFAVSVGIVFSAVIYGVVGYGLSGQGVMSRTMAAQSLYFAVAIGVFTSVTAEKTLLLKHLDFRKLIFMAAITTIILIMLLSFMIRMSEWVKIQNQSKIVLQTVSTQMSKYLLEMGDQQDLVVVVQIDGDQNGEIFGASWEISGGVLSFNPGLNHGKKIRYITARSGAWRTVWDGDEINQTWCNSPKGGIIESNKTNRSPLLLQINPNNGLAQEIKKLQPNNDFGCDVA